MVKNVYALDIPKIDIQLRSGDQFVIPMDHFTTVGLILKKYGVKEDEFNPTKNASYLLHKEIIDNALREKSLDPQLGIGFSVWSSGVFSIFTWGRESPQVIFPQIYEFERENGEWQKKDIEKIGAFCGAEGRVYCHELKIWQRFLGSERSRANLKGYLENFLDSEIL